jgi:hypothetical protein
MNKDWVGSKNMEKIQKYALPALGAIFGIASLMILLQVVLSPQEGATALEKPNEDSSEVLKATDLRLKSLEAKANDMEKNIKKIYSNQVKLNESIASLIETDESIKKNTKENRAYIAMIYQRVLDSELQISNLGGGFNVKPRPKEEPINPLIGTEELPQTPPNLE